MVQKNKKAAPTKAAASPRIDAAAPRRRGRPRAYEPDVALAKALDLFRKDGFAATSLDDLSAATGMNRPSLYGAFGDKRELYIKSYQRYRDDARAATAEIFRQEMPIRKRLERIYGVALDIYFVGESRPSGCFTVMTAGSEAVADPDIRGVLTRFGVNLCEMLQRPQTVALIRIVIAASAQFPDIGRTLYASGPAHGIKRISAYFDAQVARGALSMRDTELAAAQFIELCLCRSLKPLLFSVTGPASRASIEANVTSAVDMILAAYGVKDFVLANP